MDCANGSKHKFALHVIFEQNSTEHKFNVPKFFSPTLHENVSQQSYINTKSSSLAQ